MKSCHKFLAVDGPIKVIEKNNPALVSTDTYEYIFHDEALSVVARCVSNVSESCHQLALEETLSNLTLYPHVYSGCLNPLVEACNELFTPPPGSVPEDGRYYNLLDIYDRLELVPSP